MINKLSAIVLIFLLGNNFLFATAVLRDNVIIQQIHPMSMDRIHCGEKCSGVTRIYVNSGAWGNTSCRADAVDLYKEDEHILSLLMFAWVTGKKLNIEVNDQAKPIGIGGQATLSKIKPKITKIKREKLRKGVVSAPNS